MEKYPLWARLTTFIQPLGKPIAVPRWEGQKILEELFGKARKREKEKEEKERKSSAPLGKRRCAPCSASFSAELTSS